MTAELNKTADEQRSDTADTPRYWVEPENWKPGPPYPNWCFVRAPDGGTIAWCTTKDAAQMIADAINRVSTTRLHVAVDDTLVEE